MALSANTPRQYDTSVAPEFADLVVTASKTIYEGAAVSDDGGAGTVDNVTGTETFEGFAEQKVVSSATAGAYRIRVRTRGIVKNLPVTGITAATDYGIGVYATDEGTFTTTASGASQIGKVARFVAAGYADVYFEGGTKRSI